jgi:hypothetical protein
MANEIRIEPEEPEAARAEIERTRARMSETIDEIEDVLLRKKSRLQDQLDVGARLREQPLKAAGIVFGIGLLLGFLTGGDDEDPAERLAAERRAQLWETRARRLLRIAREQEEEIDDLEAVVSDYTLVEEWEEDWDDDVMADRMVLVEEIEPRRGLRAALSDASRGLVGRFRRGD